jgi:DNA-binding GntR family transcriptional regulator
MLISEGLIISFGKNSIYVKELTLKSARDLMSLLYYLGDVIFSLASRNEDYAPLICELENHLRHMEEAIQKEEYSDFALSNSIFHKTLAKMANNEYLETLFDKLYNEEKRLSFIISLEKLNGDSVKGYYEKVQEQHRELVQLLKAKDFEGLKKAYQTHMKVGQTRLFRYFSQ